MKNNQTFPLISVVMPVYNAEGFLSESIESILQQTYTNWELIIVDDASTDSSWKIINHYRELYPQKIVPIRLARNMNAGGDVAGEIGYEIARGDFVARMDADDVALPMRLEQQLGFMQKHLDVDIVGSSAIVINSVGDIIGEKLVPLTHAEIKKEFFVFNPLINPTVMIRKGRFGSKFYFIRYPSNNDYWTYFKYLMNGKVFANIAEPLLKYRVHSSNDSLAHVRRTFINSAKIRFEAVKLGYRPNLAQVLGLLFQGIAVMTLPPPILREVYYLAKGIRNWKDYLSFLR